MKNGIEYLLALNKRHSALFDAMHSERAQYRALHKTEIAFIKCMDGRVHGAVMTRTPLGIIQPWRNLGGMFDIGWFGFAQSIKEWFDYAVNQGHDCLVFATYHFAKGDRERGCRGFHYDIDVARESTKKLKDQFDRVFRRRGLYAIQCGIETDEESFVLHGDAGETVYLSDHDRGTDSELSMMLCRLYPNMPHGVVKDLLRLVRGNIEHSRVIRAMNRPVIDVEHREWVLAVGRGFDWLHEVNTALIVGPYDPNLDGAIRTAATLIKGNIDEGRIDVPARGGVVLLSSAPYRGLTGPARFLAAEKAKFLNAFALEVIREAPELHDLLPRLEELTVTMDYNTRQIGRV